MLTRTDLLRTVALALSVAHHVADQTAGRRRGNTVLGTADTYLTWLRTREPAATFTITADPPVDRPTEGHHMSLTITDGQQDTLRVSGVTDAWNENVTDTFTWTVDNGNVLALTASDDTQSCLVVPGVDAGSAVVTATASDGVTRTFAIDVTTGPTAAFEITSDGPVDRPVAAPPAETPAP